VNLLEEGGWSCSDAERIAGIWHGWMLNPVFRILEFQLPDFFPGGEEVAGFGVNGRW